MILSKLRESYLFFKLKLNVSGNLKDFLLTKAYINIEAVFLLFNECVDFLRHILNTSSTGN